MTDRQKEALKGFAEMTGRFANISRFHMLRLLPEDYADLEARKEIEGYYRDLIAARDILVTTLRDE